MSTDFMRHHQDTADAPAASQASGTSQAPDTSETSGGETPDFERHPDMPDQDFDLPESRRSVGASPVAGYDVGSAPAEDPPIPSPDPGRHADDGSVNRGSVNDSLDDLTGTADTGALGTADTVSPEGDTVVDAQRATAYHDRLHEIQASFIDDPRQAAQDADRLLAEVAQEFCGGLEARRRRLGSVTDSDGRGDGDPDRDSDESAGTESLRLAMQQYRGLVDSLLSC